MLAAGTALLTGTLLTGTLLTGTLLAGTASAGTAPAGQVAASFKAISVTWVTPQQGWVLGVAPCGPAGRSTCTEVISSSNGGATWTADGTVPAHTPPARGATTGATEIRFDTPAIGWAFGPDLFRTANGGRSWAPQRIPGTGSRQVLALAATATAAYAVTSPCAYQAATCAGGGLSVWRARTGSGSWVKVPLTLPLSGAAGLTAFGSAVYADDATRAGNHLYASANGGATFASRPVPCDASQGTVLAQAVATSASRVALLCVGSPGIGKAVKTVYRSGDTGKTYASAGTTGAYGIESQLASSPSGNLAVATTSAQGSFIYANVSGGTAWSTSLGLYDEGWNDIVYVTDNEAWLVYGPASGLVPAAGKVLVTHDGGRHWTIAGL